MEEKRTWRRGQKADYTDRPLSDEERAFAEKNHDYLYQFMKWNHLAIEEWYDVLVIPYLNAVKKYCSKPELHIYSFYTIAEKVLSRAVYGKHRADHALKRMPEGGFVSLDYELEGDNPYSENHVEAWWIDQTKNVEAYVVETEFLREMLENVYKYAESELLKAVIIGRIKGYSDMMIAKWAKENLTDDYHMWTTREILELIRLITGKHSTSQLRRLVRDTQKYGNIDNYNKWEDLHDIW